MKMWWSDSSRGLTVLAHGLPAPVVLAVVTLYSEPNGMTALSCPRLPNELSSSSNVMGLVIAAMARLRMEAARR